MIVRTIDSRGRLCVLDLEQVAFAVYDLRSLRDSRRENVVAEEHSVRVHLRGIATPIWLHAEAWPLFEKLAEQKADFPVTTQFAAASNVGR